MLRPYTHLMIRPPYRVTTVLGPSGSASLARNMPNPAPGIDDSLTSISTCVGLEQRHGVLISVKKEGHGVRYRFTSDNQQVHMIRTVHGGGGGLGQKTWATVPSPTRAASPRTTTSAPHRWLFSASSPFREGDDVLAPLCPTFLCVISRAIGVSRWTA